MDHKNFELGQLQLLQNKYAGRIDMYIETRNDMQVNFIMYTNHGTGNDNPKYHIVTRKLSWFTDNSKEIEEIKQDLFNIVGF